MKPLRKYFWKASKENNEILWPLILQAWRFVESFNKIPSFYIVLDKPSSLGRYVIEYQNNETGTVREEKILKIKMTNEGWTKTGKGSQYPKPTRIRNTNFWIFSLLEKWLQKTDMGINR